MGTNKNPETSWMVTELRVGWERENIMAKALNEILNGDKPSRTTGLWKTKYKLIASEALKKVRSMK